MHADIDTVKVVVKNVPDYAAGKEKNDLGFLTFDLQVEFFTLTSNVPFFHDPATFISSYISSICFLEGSLQFVDMKVLLSKFK